MSGPGVGFPSGQSKHPRSPRRKEREGPFAIDWDPRGQGCRREEGVHVVDPETGGGVHGVVGSGDESGTIRGLGAESTGPSGPARPASRPGPPPPRGPARRRVSPL